MKIETTAVERAIQAGESLTVEFKSERTAPLSDREIYETVVCLANASGGLLLLGVDDDGIVTGSRPRHGASTDHLRLQAAIFNNTAPPINTRVSLHQIANQDVLVIEVDAYPEVCATRDGRSLRRVLGVGGPACLPFYPSQHASRRSDLGLLDYSAQLLDGLSWHDLDPLEIVRLRQTIERRRGDQLLLSLDDQQLVQALRLVESHGDSLVPSRAVGVLTQRGATHARGVLERLAERGLVESRGEQPGRDYRLGAAFEGRSGTPGAAGRPPGFDRSRQEALILQYVQDHGRITRRDAMQLGGLSEDQASRLLRRLARQNLLHLTGTGRATAYTRPTV